MKKMLVFLPIIILILSISILTSEPPPNSFNVCTGEIRSTNHYNWLHEKGHALCKELNFICMSGEYKEAVITYHQTCAPNEAYCFMIEKFPGILGHPRRESKDCNITTSCFWVGGWGGYVELYARMYQYSEGDIDTMPEVFQTFFTN